MAITKSKKSGIMGRVTSAVIPAVVGAAVGVVDDAVGSTNSEMVAYGAIGAGILLPTFVKGTDKVGDSLAAVGGFMMSKSLGLADKIGLTDVASTTGLGDRAVMGNAPSNMFHEKKNFSQGKSSKTSNTNPMG